MDVVHTEGFGPENLAGEKGKTAAGEDRWFVEHYRERGRAPAPTRWTVLVRSSGVDGVVEGILERRSDRSRIQISR